jgi:hypothetical protein
MLYSLSFVGLGEWPQDERIYVASVFPQLKIGMVISIKQITGIVILIIVAFI